MSVTAVPIGAARQAFAGIAPVCVGACSSISSQSFCGERWYALPAQERVAATTGRFAMAQSSSIRRASTPSSNSRTAYQRYFVLFSCGLLLWTYGGKLDADIWRVAPSLQLSFSL